MSGRDAAGGGLIARAHRSAAKKWPIAGIPPSRQAAGLISRKVVRIKSMEHDIFRPSRRAVLAGLGAATLRPLAAPAAEEPAVRTLLAAPGLLALRGGQADTAIWSLAGASLGFKQGERADIAFANELAVPVVLNWRGLDGASAAEPLVSRAPVAATTRDTFSLSPRHAGTFLCDPALLGDGAARPIRGLPLIIAEREAVAVDRDETLMIEDWRLRGDGSAIAPGNDPKDTTPVYTVNGKLEGEVRLRTNERLRIRFISAFQRHVIAIKIEGFDSWVMALDGQPSEPFLARGGLILAPGGRTDVFIDASEKAPGTSSPILLHDGKEAHPIARLIVLDDPPIRSAALPPPRPLPSNGLPVKLDLKGALRIDLSVDGSQPDWVAPARFGLGSSPAFRAKVGRTVVLALTNRSGIATVFHLHGHHFRLLDRLDDGWKPFWLDTLPIEAGQTQRIAFAAEYTGRWLMESAATDWAAPRLLRWYSVE
jgi:FtsP/CotA-like multicopper oxidase with cupredoxin domain